MIMYDHLWFNCLQTIVCVTVFCVYWQDRELTRWVHEVFLQSLDYNLLPVYLDVLQVLRSKVHSTWHCELWILLILLRLTMMSHAFKCVWLQNQPCQHIQITDTFQLCSILAIYYTDVTNCLQLMWDIV